jgi:hypothetical protein
VRQRVKGSRRGEVRGNPPPPAAHTAHSATPHEPRRFDWVTETDRSIGPVPNVSDFHPRKRPSPLPIRTTPKRTVSPPRRDVAPRARTSATDAPTTPTTPCVHTPVSHTKYPTPVTAPSQVPTKRVPAAIAYGPCDLSMLRSDAPNPWGTLRRRHYHRYSRTPWQFGSVKWEHFAQSYPANKPIHKHPISKSTPSSSFRIFETVKHPHGIGPNKPVI